VDLRRRPVALGLGVALAAILVLGTAAGYVLQDRAPEEALPVAEAPAPFGGAESDVMPAAPADTATEGGQP